MLQGDDGAEKAQPDGTEDAAAHPICREVPVTYSLQQTPVMFNALSGRRAKVAGCKRRDEERSGVGARQELLKVLVAPQVNDRRIVRIVMRVAERDLAGILEERSDEAQAECEGDQFETLLSTDTAIVQPERQQIRR
jgi:hypothetical protein